MDILIVAMRCLSLSKSEIRSLAIASRKDSFDLTEYVKEFVDEFTMVYPLWSITITDDFKGVEISTISGFYSMSNLFRTIDRAITLSYEFSKVERGLGNFNSHWKWHEDNTKYTPYNK
jgi:hypothetical protein